jgi:phosphatidylglycerophosphate synthase
MAENIFGMFIGLVFVICTAGVVVFFGYIRMKRHVLQHEERKMAMEKGLVIPEEPESRKNPVIAHKNAAIQNRKAFLILFFLGLAFAIFIPADKDTTWKLFGGILVFLSFAFLIMSTFKYKLSDEEKEYYAQMKRNRMEHHTQDYGEKITAERETDNKDSDVIC